MNKPTFILSTILWAFSSLAVDANAMAVDDCNHAALVPQGFTRIYISSQNGNDGSGKSAGDARNGSTAEKFDRILRCYSEGCSDPAAPGRSIGKTQNLIVCLSAGTFRTKGSYDFLINVPHAGEGFTVGKGWKIHGAGQDKTTVQLAAYLPITEEPNPRNMPTETGVGLVFSTNSDDASNIEISDLTVDNNYPALKKRADQEGIRALNLEAIHLRSSAGHDWIHDIKVINAAGEIGAIDIKYETFPVWIYSVKPNSSPADNAGSVIERVTMTSYGGGKCTAIAVANAMAEVRDNRVEGYQIGYGGWIMGPVWFHDNVAVDTEYGFNIDSLGNKGVRIERNQIIHPRKFGIVIGGSGSYDDFWIRGNTVQINRPGVIGLVLQGNVRNGLVADNNFLADDIAARATAIRSFSNGRAAGPNRSNNFQGNKISEKLKINFSDRSKKQDNCVSGNRDERGAALRDLQDNHASPCVAIAGSSH